MGEYNLYRYIDTNSVPNTNSSTYSANSIGTSLDMGEANSYRYVNTSGLALKTKSFSVTFRDVTSSSSTWGETSNTISLTSVPNYSTLKVNVNIFISGVSSWTSYCVNGGNGTRYDTRTFPRLSYNSNGTLTCYSGYWKHQFTDWGIYCDQPKVMNILVVYQ